MLALHALPGAFRRLSTGEEVPSPFVSILECPLCHQRYYCQPILQSFCPECHASLDDIGVWNLRFEAWPLIGNGG